MLLSQLVNPPSGYDSYPVLPALAYDIVLVTCSFYSCRCVHVHLKINILSSFAHHHVDPNWHDLLEHKKWVF